MRFIGGVLLAVGILIAMLSGLCTVAALTTHTNGILSIAAPPLLIGLMLIGLGIAIHMAGSGDPPGPGGT